MTLCGSGGWLQCVCVCVCIVSVHDYAQNTAGTDEYTQGTGFMMLQTKMRWWMNRLKVKQTQLSLYWSAGDELRTITVWGKTLPCSLADTSVPFTRWQQGCGWFKSPAAKPSCPGRCTLSANLCQFVMFPLIFLRLPQKTNAFPS